MVNFPVSYTVTARQYDSDEDERRTRRIDPPPRHDGRRTGSIRETPPPCRRGRLYLFVREGPVLQPNRYLERPLDGSRIELFAFASVIAGLAGNADGAGIAIEAQFRLVDDADRDRGGNLVLGIFDVA